jgi:hypothetical protein
MRELARDLGSKTPRYKQFVEDQQQLLEAYKEKHKGNEAKIASATTEIGTPSCGTSRANWQDHA